jgi:hypothetical protein
MGTREFNWDWVLDRFKVGKSGERGETA